jgi:hypothetical protein
MSQPKAVERKVPQPIAIRRSAAGLATVHSGEANAQSINSDASAVAAQPCSIKLNVTPQVKQASIQCRSRSRFTASKASLARRSKVRTTPVVLWVLAVSRWQQH